MRDLNIEKEPIVKRSYKLAAGAVAAATLAIAAAAFAQPGPMGMMGPMGHRGMGPGGADMSAVQSLMTPEGRAKEKGITLPQPHGRGMGFGPNRPQEKQ